MEFDVIDDNLLELISYMQKFFINHYSDLILFAQAVGALVSLFVVGMEAYKVMIRQKGFDIFTILRPIVISFVIASWIPFCLLISSPFKKIEEFGKNLFQTEILKLKDLKDKKWEATLSLHKRVREAKAAARITEAQIAQGSIIDKISELGANALDWINDSITAATMIYRRAVMDIFMEIITYLGGLFWKIMVYLTFFIKEVFIAILIITGPLTFALSSLNIWKDAWVSWLSRYISLNIYGFIAYLVLCASVQIMKYGIEVDLKILLEVKNMTITNIMAYGGDAMNLSGHIISIIIGGLTLRFVPEISSWLIPGGVVQSAKDFAAGVIKEVQSKVEGGAKMAAAAI